MYSDNSVPRCPFATDNEDAYTPSVQENVPDFVELRGVFEPLTSLAAERIEDIIATAPDAFRERASQIATYQIPFARELSLLPPGIFSHRPPAFPGTHEEIDSLMEEFEREHATNGTPAEQLAWKTGRNNPLNELRVSLVSLLYQGGVGIDSAACATYQDVYAQHIAHGTEKDLIGLWRYRKREVTKHSADWKDPRVSSLDTMGGKFATFVYAHVRTGMPPTMEVPANLVMPVGAYGEAFANKLLRSTTLAIESLSTIVDAEAATAAQEHGDVLRRRTARGASESPMRFDHEFNILEPLPITAATPKATLQEGALSMMQAIALLTANMVPGYDNPDALLHDMIDQGVIERFTRKIPMGYVGPLTLTGVYYPNPLHVLDGKLELTPDFTTHLKELKTAYIAKALASLQWRYDLRDKPEDLETAFESKLAIICPVAGERSGISKLTKTLSALYRTL